MTRISRHSLLLSKHLKDPFKKNKISQNDLDNISLIAHSIFTVQIKMQNFNYCHKIINDYIK